MKNFIIRYLIGLQLILSISYSFVKTDGQQIVDQYGNEIIFRGIGIGGWLMPEGYMLKTQGYGSPSSIKKKIIELIGEDGANEFYKVYRENYFTEKDVKQIKDWGFNSIRLPFHYNILAEIEPQLIFKENGFSIIDSVLTWCEKHEIYLILDMHAAPGGQNHGNISDSDGVARLWTDPKNQDLTVNIWTEIAKRYSDEIWIAAFDLLNEPVMPDGFTNIDLRQLYTRIAKSIREVDKNHVIIIEGNWYATDFAYLTPPLDQNLVYGFHKYWSPNSIGSIQQYLNIRKNYNVPLWLGEFGENSNHWFYEIIQLAEENSIGWNWWTYKKFDSITSPLSTPLTPEYSELIKYWKNEIDKPSQAFAKDALIGMAKRLNIDSCKVHKDVIHSITSFISDQNNSEEFTNHQIPGRIEIEHYDIGKNNISYNDNDIEKLHWENFDPWNNGWVFRNDGVDIGESETYPSTFYVGWTEPGEWLKYSVNIPYSGKYFIKIKVASQISSSTIQFSIMNLDQSVRIDIPSTHSWNNWEYVEIGNFNLLQGEDVFTIEIKNGSINLDHIDIEFLGSNQFQSGKDDVFIGKTFPNPTKGMASIPIISNISTEFEIQIIDIIGSTVRRIYGGNLSSGSHVFRWDGKNQQKEKVGNGVYFFLIKYGNNLISERFSYIC